MTQIRKGDHGWLVTRGFFKPSVKMAVILRSAATKNLLLLPIAARKSRCFASGSG
jgi:hypothetical protein